MSSHLTVRSEALNDRLGANVEIVALESARSGRIRSIVGISSKDSACDSGVVDRDMMLCPYSAVIDERVSIASGCMLRIASMAALISRFPRSKVSLSHCSHACPEAVVECVPFLDCISKQTNEVVVAMVDLLLFALLLG
jgi:hypothetical protein